MGKVFLRSGALCDVLIIHFSHKEIGFKAWRSSWWLDWSCLRMRPGPEVFSGRLLVSNRSYFSSKAPESFQLQPKIFMPNCVFVQYIRKAGSPGTLLYSGLLLFIQIWQAQENKKEHKKVWNTIKIPENKQTFFCHCSDIEHDICNKNTCRGGYFPFLN